VRYIVLVSVSAAGVGGRLIRRYDNRKLYDPAGRRYVTVADLARMIGRGEELQVQDQRTGEDLTTLVLGQVVLEGLKQRTARIPRQVLARLIRLGSGPAAAWGHWPGPQEVAAQARGEAERIVSGLLARGRLSLEEALALRQDIAQSVHRLVAEAQHGLEARIHALIDQTEGQGATASLQALKERLMVFENVLNEPARKRKRR
jgi:polyhydroxyalkanoate synthesis repressor PhaR